MTFVPLQDFNEEMDDCYDVLKAILREIKQINQILTRTYPEPKQPESGSLDEIFGKKGE